MGLVVGDLLVLILVVSVAAAIAFRVSKRRDELEAAAQRLAKLNEQRLAEKEAKLYQAGVPLICLGCDTRFSGPLPTNGCPECHVSSLVLTVEDYSKTVEAQSKLR